MIYLNISDKPNKPNESEQKDTEELENNEIKFVRIKSAEDMQAYYIDTDKDAWEDEETYKEWVLESHPEDEYFISCDDFGEVMERSQCERLLLEGFDWAIEDYITKNKYPEYFL